MHYENYQTEDFLRDDDFIQWVKNPGNEQKFFWENWLAQHPEKAQTVARARGIILSVNYKNVYQPSAADLASVWENIKAGEKSGASVKRPSLRILWPTVIRSIAAILVFSLVSLLAWRYTVRRDISEKPVTLNAERVEIKTLAREKRVVTLPDGSTVKMNSNSMISYLSDFGTGNRVLQLEGEAYFDVMPNKTRPFRIQTGRLVTTVVGTSFNINAYPQNPQIRVAVRTGRVEVASAPTTGERQKLILVPDQMSVFERAEDHLTAMTFSPELEFAWISNVIVLKNADFQEIKKTLEREYAVTFVVDKGLKVKEEFSAKFENAPIKKVLDALNYTSRFQYNLVKDKVYVTKKDEK